MKKGSMIENNINQTIASGKAEEHAWLPATIVRKALTALESARARALSSTSAASWARAMRAAEQHACARVAQTRGARSKSTLNLKVPLLYNSF
mgnify:CR=1 FL=1